MADTASDTKCDLATPFNRGCDLPKGHAGGCEGPRKATEATCPHCKRENSLIELNGRQQCKNCPYDSRTKATFDDKWIQSVCRDAADEIERLTQRIDYHVEEYQKLCAASASEGEKSRVEIERLRALMELEHSGKCEVSG